MEYANSDEAITPPSGQEHPEWQHLLHLAGWNRMLGPLRLIPGADNQPALHAHDQHRTGLYWAEDRVRYTREGLARGELVAAEGTPAEGQVPRWRDASQTYVPGDVGLEWTVINSEAFSILAGQPVKPDGASGILLAQASSASNRAWAVAAEDIAAGASGQIVLYGPVTRVDWSAVTTPSVATLTRGVRYFLAQATAGLLTPTPPSGPGDIIQLQGTALDTTTLLVGPYGRYMQL